MSDIAGSMTTQVNDNTQQIIQSVEDRTNRLKDAVTEVVRNEVSTIHKFNSLGLINIYEKLSLSTIIEKIKSTGGELAVQRMYFSGAEFQLLEELDYADLIEKRNCSFRFLLLHPNESNTIKKKMSSFSKFSNDARALEKEKERIVGTIHHQLKFLEEKKAELTELKLGDQFQFKIHQDFVSIPLTKYKDKIIFSAYLDHRYAEDGIQFVSRKADKAKLYNELLEHYEHRWERAESYKGHIIKPNANR
jgi:hypothetical protein